MHKFTITLDEQELETLKTILEDTLHSIYSVGSMEDAVIQGVLMQICGEPDA